MFETKVTTSYTNGTIINFDPNDALNFLVGLSITVINTVRDTFEDEDDFGDKVLKNCDPNVMHLIRHYNSGIPESTYSCILQTNAYILLKFVEDVVLNDTTRGLYLFYNQSNKRNGGATPFDLIVKALENVHQFYMTHGNGNYKKNKRNYFNRYNNDFINLINHK